MRKRITDFIQKKLVQDMILNIIATIVPIGTLQLVVYPVMANKLGGDKYGFMLTIYSLLIMIPNSLGAVLNNIRLLYNKKYEDKDKIGDFAVLYRRWNCLSAIVLFFLIWFYCNEFDVLHILFGMVIGFILLTRVYLEVGFRLEFDYKKILYSNLLQGIGFIVGCGIAIITGIWEFIYFFGYLSSCIYAVVNTPLLLEKPIKSRLFSDINRDSYSLLASVVINSLAGYADKLVLFPIMGGMAVSIYYTATILGKILSMLTTPINGVILNYVASWDKDKNNIFGKALTSSIMIAVIGYFLAIAISRPVLTVLFPQWVDEVMIYIPITSLAVMINLIASVLQPFVMKFCRIEWQTIVNLSSTVVYFASSLFLWRKFGLTGFCMGTVVGAILKVVLLTVVYFRYAKQCI